MVFESLCSVLSGYGRNSLDNELDMELEDEEEMDGFTEDRCVLLFTALKSVDLFFCFFF